jgi:hypothetical protein
MSSPATCHQCGTEFGQAGAFCTKCGAPRTSPGVESALPPFMPPPVEGTGWSSLSGQPVAQPEPARRTQVKSAPIITVLAAIGGVGSILAVLIWPLSYFLADFGSEGRDPKVIAAVVICAVLYLVPSLFLGVHAVGALQKRDLYPERDGVFIAAAAAATVVFIRFASLARVVVGGDLEPYHSANRFWYEWGLTPLVPEMNNFLRMVGVVVLFSIGAAAVACVLFIAEAKFGASSQRSSLTRQQRRGVTLILVVAVILAPNRWDSGDLVLADVIGAIVVMLFLYVGGVAGERAATIVGITIGLFTVASILTVFVDAIFFRQFVTDGLFPLVLANGLIVLGCYRRCSNGQRWKEALQAPRLFLKQRASTET